MVHHHPAAALPEAAPRAAAQDMQEPAAQVESRKKGRDGTDVDQDESVAMA